MRLPVAAAGRHVAAPEQQRAQHGGADPVDGQHHGRVA